MNSILISYFILSLSFLFKSSQIENVLVGEKFLGHRVIITDITQDEIIAEVGGTSLKMRSEIISLRRIVSSSENIVAISDNNQSYIIKRHNKLHFIYNGFLGKREFKLMSVPYTEEINTIRYRIFVNHFFKMENNRTEKLKLEFNIYCKNEIQYIKNKS